MRPIATIFYLVAALLYTLLACAVIVPCFVITAAFDWQRRAMDLLAYLFAVGFMRICPLWRFDISGRENIVKGRRYVVTANHQSMLDITLLYMALGRLHGKFVSKREVYRIPFFGWALWMRRDIAIERGSASAFMKVISRGRAYIDKGIPVIIFPEGTRSKDGEVHRFKESAFILASQTGADILPCVMDGTRNVLQGGWLVRRRMTVRILSPVTAEQAGATTSKEMAERVRQMTAEELEKIRKER